MQYDIIIPHFGHTQELTEKCLACLRSIKEHSVGGSYRIIFVDNASPQFDAVLPTLFQQSHLLVRNTVNVGFVKAVNQGLHLSNAPYVVLLNNDTEVAPYWLDLLQAPFVNPQVGLTGPVSTAAGSWQSGIPVTPGWHVTDRPMLAFFCTMIRRAVLEQVGYLDEDFGLGFGDDDYYCFRAKHAGWQLAIVTELLIKHHHRSTFQSMFTREQIQEMQNIALAKFKDKRRACLQQS